MPLNLPKVFSEQNNAGAPSAIVDLPGEMSESDYRGGELGAKMYYPNFSFKAQSSLYAGNHGKNYHDLKAMYAAWAQRTLKGPHYVRETKSAVGPDLAITLLDPRDIAAARGYWQDGFQFDEHATILNIEETCRRAEAGFKPEAPSLRRYFAQADKAAAMARSKLESFPRPSRPSP